MARTKQLDVTVLDENILNDKTLTFTAIGVYATMEYMTQHLGYHDISPRDIAELFPNSITEIKGAMEELIAHGYITGDFR